MCELKYSYPRILGNSPALAHPPNEVGHSRRQSVFKTLE